jgi:hypothetical protein
MDPKKFEFTSRETEFISKRFLVKGSVAVSDDADAVVMILVQDVLEKSFRIRYFRDPNEAARFVQMLRLVNQN